MCESLYVGVSLCTYAALIDLDLDCQALGYQMNHLVSLSIVHNVRLDYRYAHR